jgi:putative addiction module CopG family antidote
MSITVSLSDELEQFVDAQLRAGSFSSPDEVLRESLRRMKEREEHIQWLRKEVALGFAQLERGEYRKYDAASLAAWRQELEANASQTPYLPISEE